MKSFRIPVLYHVVVSVNVTLVKLLQPKNAKLKIDVTLSPMVMLVKLLQLENA